MMKSTTISFNNRDGFKLFGILEEPTGNRNDIAILLLSPGIKMRVGPHRLYNKLSRILVECGFTVLRYDFYGLGDSEGDVQESVLVDVYNSIQDGRYVNDTIDAMDWMEREHHFNRFILGGLCGGAITGMIAGNIDKRVDGLIALGLINVFEGGEGNFAKFVTEGQLEDLKAGYLKKLTDIDSWKRILSFKSDFKTIFKIIFKPVRSLVSNIKKHSFKHTKTHEIEFIHDQSSNCNPKFAPTFFSMLKQSKRMLLIYSGGDRLLWEFKEKFEDVYKDHLLQYDHLYNVITIPEANHILSLVEWEESMHDHVKKWLRDNY